MVGPGADPGAIRFAFEGLDGEGSRAPLRIDADGNLVVPIPGGEVVQHAPVIYQEADGVRQPVAGRFVLLNGAAARATARMQTDSSSSSPSFGPRIEAQTESLTPETRHQTPDVVVGFALAAYDPTRPLVIDPALVYSTYLGGSGDDQAAALRWTAQATPT